MNERQRALLVLEDGRTFLGWSIGAAGETFGELVFNTGMTGYQEVLTDPSYCGQIVVMTYPEIGIYGVNPEDGESDGVPVAGFVVHRAVRGWDGGPPAFNPRATGSFLDYLTEAGVVAIEGVDTRALTRHLRTHGAQRGAISTTDLDADHLLARVRRSPKLTGRDLVRDVGEHRASDIEHRARASRLPSSASRFGPQPARIPTPAPHVVVVDCGVKANIVRDLVAYGARVTRVPYDADLDAVLALAPDGVLVSNGPGDPAPLHATVDLMRGLLARRVPLAGICLGHQLLGLALGGTTYKLRFGHRGANHPVKDLSTGQVRVTTQNHGFAVDPTSLGIDWTPLEAGDRQITRPIQNPKPKTQNLTLPAEPLTGESPAGFGPVAVTHLSLNDGTVEGLRLCQRPAVSVQYHPEASPGPHDARGFFADVIRLVQANR
jgi:carbamoyl-phosphate synthase small subunit